MNKLKSMRVEKKYTQEDVSKMIGVKRSTYAKYESGHIALSVKRMKKIAEVFNCGIETFLL